MHQALGSNHLESNPYLQNSSVSVADTQVTLLQLYQQYSQSMSTLQLSWTSRIWIDLFLFVFKLVLLSWLEVWSWAWSIKISNYPPVPILGYLLMITLYLSAEMLTLGDVNQSQTSPERHKYQDNAPPPPSPDYLPPHSGGGWVLSTPDLMRHIFDFQNKLMGSNFHNTLY